MVDGVETIVKTTFAERLADQPDIPRDLAMHLAELEARIAFPILKNSTVLTDPDLISIVMV